jgi:8-oxo-dGTP pyrophosphatase MutT (NUDIX family)
VESNTLIESTGALIYSTNTKRYLFLLRNNSKYQNTWGLPGGKIEKGETVFQGLTREIEEELGGVIAGAKLYPIEKFTSDNQKFTYHTFLIPVEEEFIPLLNNEHKGYAWCTIENHPKPLHPGVWRTINFDEVIDKLKIVQQLLNQDGVNKSG